MKKITRRSRTPWLGLVVLILLLGPGMLAQQPPVTLTEAEAVKPGIPPLPVPPSETLGWMFTLGVVANALMKKLKTWQWVPKIEDGAGRVNVAMAALFALATSLGIHTEFDAQAGSLLITGLTWTSLLHFGGDWLRQYALQQFTYQSMARDSTQT
jgi:hypothetical protein